MCALVEIAGIYQRIGRVEESSNITCPYCGQSSTVVVDTTVRSQRFTTDCEVCCRPFRVVVECEPGEILSVDVQSE